MNKRTTITSTLENRATIGATGVTLTLDVGSALRTESASWSLGTCSVRVDASGEMGLGWVVHGEPGLDELSTVGTTHVAEWDGQSVRRFTIEPEDAGLERASLADLKGGDAEENAAAIHAMLAGIRGPLLDGVRVIGAGNHNHRKIPDVRLLRFPDVFQQAKAIKVRHG